MFKLSEQASETIKDTKNCFYSKHFNKRLNERGLQYIDVFDAVKNGEIIEFVEAYGKGEKYLIYAKQKETIFHLSVAYNAGTIVFLTAYVPNTGEGHENDFMSDLKTRNKKHL